MTDLFGIWCSKAACCDRHETTTYGFTITVQLGPLVFDFFVTSRPFWRRSK